MTSRSEMQTVRTDNRIMEIWREVEESEVMSPDQEAEIEALVTAKVDDAVQAIVLSEMTIDQLKALLKEARAVLAVRESRVDAIRAQVTRAMTANGVEKVKAEDGLFTATLMAGKGGVELLVPVEDLPEQYRKEVVTVKQDTDMIRMALEAGLVPKTEDGRPVAKLNTEPYVTIRVNKDKALEYRVRGLLA